VPSSRVRSLLTAVSRLQLFRANEAQHSFGSAKKPGWRSPGRGICRLQLRQRATCDGTISEDAFNLAPVPLHILWPVEHV
jgi:hypothetical protein